MIFPVTAMWILSYDWSFELYTGYSFRPWRLLMFVYTSPGILAALWLLTFKESPKFLLMREKHDEAVEVLKWISQSNKGKGLEIGQLECEVQNNKREIANSKNT